VEGDTQGRVRIFAAFAMVEQIRLDVLEDWEQPAALLIGDALPIWTGNAADQRSCQTISGFGAAHSRRIHVPLAKETRERKTLRDLRRMP
jgi:hypothetical protein